MLGILGLRMLALELEAHGVRITITVFAHSRSVHKKARLRCQRRASMRSRSDATLEE